MNKRFFSWSLVPTVFSLALPTMLEQLMGTAVQYIDTAMVGTLGTSATAAVGATTTVNWLLGSTVSAFGVGFLAYISQAYGAGEKEKARRASGQSVLAVLLTGLLFTILALSFSGLVPIWMQVDPSIRKLASQYFFILYLPMLPRAATIIFGTVLRAVGDTKTPMRVGIGVNLINVFLNFLLIYEKRTILLFGRSLTVWGAAGACWVPLRPVLSPSYSAASPSPSRFGGTRIFLPGASPSCRTSGSSVPAFASPFPICSSVSALLLAMWLLPP